MNSTKKSDGRYGVEFKEIDTGLGQPENEKASINDRENGDFRINSLTPNNPRSQS